MSITCKKPVGKTCEKKLIRKKLSEKHLLEELSEKSGKNLMGKNYKAPNCKASYYKSFQKLLKKTETTDQNNLSGKICWKNLSWKNLLVKKSTLQMFTGNCRDFAGKLECRDFKITGIAGIPIIPIISHFR